MISATLFSVLHVFCLLVDPAVWVSCLLISESVCFTADYCGSYSDTDNNFHDAKQCPRYCCGKCSKRYCCSDKKDRLTQEKQHRTCFKFLSLSQDMHAIIVGIICGVVFPIIICVILTICCCLLCKKCRKRRNQRYIVTTPQPPTSPSGYQPSCRGYQPSYPGYQPSYPGYQPSYPGYQPSCPGYHSVPGHEGPSIPTAPPPSYLESGNPGYLPVSFIEGLPMYPLHPPSQPYAQPSLSDELVNPPYNPSYVPDP
ncbi:uncharacterized protein [Leuresthes tenuis]|uniref:uncharacterized protein n=1 Tax=Leuresthes tenuis TaxID=355514 RepID=UPI003B5148C4